MKPAHMGEPKPKPRRSRDGSGAGWRKAMAVESIPAAPAATPSPFKLLTTTPPPANCAYFALFSFVLTEMDCSDQSHCAPPTECLGLGVSSISSAMPCSFWYFLVDGFFLTDSSGSLCFKQLHSTYFPPRFSFNSTLIFSYRLWGGQGPSKMVG